MAVLRSLTDAELRATPVPVSGPLTDVQLRAVPVPVSGPLTDAEIRATPIAVATELDLNKEGENRRLLEDLSLKADRTNELLFLIYETLKGA